MKSSYFWKWFCRHREQIGQLTPDYEVMKPLMSELQYNVRSYHHALRCHVLIRYPTEERCSLVISANGDTDYFDAAEMLVNEAPEIAGWDILHLYPPLYPEFGLETELEEVGLNPSQVYLGCASEEKADKQVILHMYVDYEWKLTKEINRLVEKMVFNCAGEALFGQTIARICVHRLADSPPEILEEILPVETMEGYLETYRPRLEVGEDGTLREGSHW